MAGREARAEDSSPGGGARAQDGLPPSGGGAARGRREEADRWGGEDGEEGLKGAGEKEAKAQRGIYCGWLGSLSFGGAGQGNGWWFSSGGQRKNLDGFCFGS